MSLRPPSRRNDRLSLFARGGYFPRRFKVVLHRAPDADLVQVTRAVMDVTRFGTAEAHGRAQLMEFNVLLEGGAIASDSGRYRVVFDRLPGARSVRSIQLRPFTGRSCICRGSTLDAIDELVVSTSGASPVTVTDSCTVEGDSCRLRVAVCPTSIST